LLGCNAPGPTIPRALRARADDVIGWVSAGRQGAEFSSTFKELR